MADNVTATAGGNATPPAGTVFRTDDVGGVHYPVVKLDLGGDGVSVPAVGGIPLVPTTSGGLSVYRVVSAGSNNAANIKNAAGQVYGWYIYNSNAAARKVVLYDTASSPTPGSTTPKITLVIPGGSAANVEFTNGIAFGTGISIAMVTGLADSDNTGVAANDCIVNILYK